MTKEEKDRNTRRESIKTMLKSFGALYVGGSIWGGLINSAKGNNLVLRPPGALNEEDFLKACTKCAICVEVCPYDSLNVSGFKDSTLAGTPSFSPRDIPCYMCPDVPCTKACPTNALDIKKLHNEDSIPDINNSMMGIAVIDVNHCIAHWGIQCDACYRACPLIDKAITQDYSRNERTGVHAKLTPKINSDICTGCGICEHVCITEKPSIKVFPRDIALGVVGDHYIKGWDDDDEQRMKQKEEKKDMDDGEVQAEDYLNNWEELLDE